MIRHNNDSRSSDSDDDGSDQTHHEGPQEEAGDNAAMPSSYLVAATTTGVSTLAGLSALPLHHSHLDPSFAPSRTVLEGLTRNLPTLNSTNPVIFSPPSHFDPVVNSLLQQRFDPLLGARPGVLPFAGISNPLLLHPNQALIAGASLQYADPLFRDRQLAPSATAAPGDGILSRLARAQQNTLLNGFRNPGIDSASLLLGSAAPSAAARSELMGSTSSSSQWPALAAAQGGAMTMLDHTLVTRANPYYQAPDALNPRSVSLSSPSPTQNHSSALQQSVASRPTILGESEQDQLPIVGGPESFPMILHRALAELELVYGGRSIATFLPDGKSFQIKDQVRFEKQVLPIFFPKMKGFPSFQRQLNLYNFKRGAETKTERGTYFHPLFLRDYPIYSSRMKRTKIKGGRPRGPPRRNSTAAAQGAEGCPPARAPSASTTIEDSTQNEDDTKVTASRTADDSSASMKDGEKTTAIAQSNADDNESCSNTSDDTTTHTSKPTSSTGDTSGA